MHKQIEVDPAIISVAKDVLRFNRAMDMMLRSLLSAVEERAALFEKVWQDVAVIAEPQGFNKQIHKLAFDQVGGMFYFSDK